MNSILRVLVVSLTMNNRSVEDNYKAAFKTNKLAVIKFRHMFVNPCRLHGM